MDVTFHSEVIPCRVLTSGLESLASVSTRAVALTEWASSCSTSLWVFAASRILRGGKQRRSHEHGRALIIFKGSAGTIGVITAANNWFVHGVKQDFSQTDRLFFFSVQFCFIFSAGLMTGFFFTKKAYICIWQYCLSYLMSSIPQSFRLCHQVSKFNGLPSCLNSPDIVTIQMRERNTNEKGRGIFENEKILPSLKKHK